MKKWPILALAGLGLALSAAAQDAATPDPGPEALFERASTLAQQGRDAEAIALLEEATAAPDSPPQLSALLGALYVSAGRAGEALEVLRPLADISDADPAVLFNAARAALSTGDGNLARSYLERSVAAESGTPASRELGMVRARRGQFLDAYVLLKPWAERFPEDLQARLVAALCAVQLKRPDEALALLEDLPAEEPQVALLRAKALTEKADFWGAANLLEPVLEGAPEAMQLDIARTLADAKVAIGQAGEAVDLLVGRVGKDPSLALQLALAQYQSGDATAALATLQPFAESARAGLEQGTLPPGTPARLIFEYGRLLATAGEPARALPFLSAATRFEPDDKQTWHQLGQALAALGRTDEALEALDRFQRLVSDEAPTSVRDQQQERSLEDPIGTRLRQATRLMADGRLEEALAIAQQETVLAPTDIRPFLLEARLLLGLDRLEEALDRADALVAAADRSADAHYIRGTILVALERFEPAEAALRAALERSADHTAAMNDLAVLLMQRGDFAEARTLLERALELRPEDPLTAANLEQLDASS